MIQIDYVSQWILLGLGLSRRSLARQQSDECTGTISIVPVHLDLDLNLVVSLVVTRCH